MSSSTMRTPRRYRLHCQQCGRTWDAAYEVVSYHDLDGDHELHYRHGAPALPPWSGIGCPFCGRRHVRVLPTIPGRP
jgi:hypothetical protein